MSALEVSNDYTKEADMQLRGHVSRCLGYALVSNYAMMSLAPGDFENDDTLNMGNWLNAIYAKNDGYQACLG